MSWQPGAVQRFMDEDDLLAFMQAEELALQNAIDNEGANANWSPATPSPSPFTQNRLGARIVPRVPIRLASLSGSGFGGSSGSSSPGSNQQGPAKIDPRSVRFTEIVSTILNTLIDSGAIYKSGIGSYAFAFIPRQVAGADSFQGEIFLNLNTNKISFKDAGGAIRPLE